MTLTLVLVAAAPAAAAPSLTSIAPGSSFDQPVHLAAPPQDPHRVFVVEKAGIVKVSVDDGAPQVFLDLTAEVDDQGVEEGLFSIGFARDYATSRRFYLYFTAEDPLQGDGSRIKIVEFTRPKATPNLADPLARRTLVELPHPTESAHNGGQLQIAADGTVWFATGDGFVDRNDAQDPGSLMGKLARIDPSQANPQPEILASGLRNPWRFSFDRTTGDLALGDVGSGAREEIDFAPRAAPAGRNYGWPCFEATLPGPENCQVADHTPPVFDYVNNDDTCAISGGYVVRDPDLPTLVGRYLYSDLCRERMHSIALPAAGDDREEPTLELPSTVSFGEDSCGHLYAISIGGTVARVQDGGVTPCPEPPPPPPDPDPTPAPGPTPTPDPPPSASPGNRPPAADGTGTGAGTGTGTATDSRAPRLKIRRARRQRLLRNKAVYVEARCDERCGLATESNVRLHVDTRTLSWNFPAISRFAPARAVARFRLQLTEAMRAALEKRVAQGTKPLVTVVVTARDAAGNETRKVVFVRVVG